MVCPVADSACFSACTRGGQYLSEGALPAHVASTAALFTGVLSLLCLSTFVRVVQLWCTIKSLLYGRYLHVRQVTHVVIAALTYGPSGVR